MKEQTYGTVFDIQHFSVGDGPGIRTTVFFKGCPLRCLWCHNPESQSINPQIYFNKNNCTLCQKCKNICSASCHTFNDCEHTFSSKACNLCKKCIDICPYNALELIGKKMSVEEVIKEVLEDMPFYQGIGGMTLSGGEPLFQVEFATELLKAAKGNHIHTCIETSGFCRNGIEEIAKYTDLFLFDYKAATKLHKKLTGVDNTLILKNLFYLNSTGKTLILRCPIVPCQNMNYEHIDEMISLAKKLSNITEIDILPYHNAGTEKRIGLGTNEPAFTGSVPQEEELQKIALYVQSKTNISTIIV